MIIALNRLFSRLACFCAINPKSHVGQRYLALAALLCGALVTMPALARPAGSLPGKFAVSSTGAAGYTIPIDLPPGINGLAPKLALVYDSQGSVGVAGYGWTLSGLSAIARCGKTIAQDGVIQPLTFTDGPNGDDYCLDGEKLRPDGSGNYRTEIDKFSKVTPESSGGGGAAPANGPQWFKVQAKNGLTYYYGYTASSEIFGWPTGYLADPACTHPSKSTSVVRVWALSSIQDRSGNSVNFNYCQDVGTGDYWISSITYNASSGTGGGTQTLVFSYDDLASLSTVPAEYKTNYRGGMLVGHSERLNGITLSFGGVTTKVYSLRYQLDSATHYSELTSVTECGGSSCTPANTSNSTCGGTCLPSTDIQWGTSSRGWTVNSTSQPLYFNFLLSVRFPVNLFEDGKSELLFNDAETWGAEQVSTSGQSLTLLGSNALDFFISTVTPPGQTIQPHFVTSAVPMVFTNQGKSSILEREDDSSDNGLTESLHILTFSDNGTSTMLTSDYATGLSSWGTSSDLPLNFIPSPGVADVNGDGFDDIILPDFYPNGDVGLYAYLNNRGSFSANQVPVPIYDSGSTSADINAFMQLWVSGIRTADFDGDGRTDMVVYQDSNLVALVSRQDSNGNPILKQYGSKINVGPESVVYQPLLLDANGDGLTDIAYVCPANSTTCTSGDWMLAISTGTGFEVFDTGVTAVSPGLALVADYNGDGRQDILYPTATEWYALEVTYNAGGSSANYYSLSAPIDTGIPVSQLAADMSARVADYDGDGQLDIIGDDSNDDLTLAIHNPISLRVASITDGFANNISVNYGSLASESASSYYNRSDYDYPIAPFEGALYVVSSYSADSGASDGSSGNYTVSYTYNGAARDLQGRGFLGFESITANDSRFGTTTTTYRLEFPYTGKVKNQVVSTTAGNELRGTSNAWQNLPTTSNGEAVFPYVATSAATTYGSDTSTDEGIAGVTKTVVTNSTYDAWGNPTLVTTDTNASGGVPQFETNVVSAYNEDSTSNWCLDLPTNVTVEKLIGATDTSPQTGTTNNSYIQQAREVAYTNDYANCRVNSKLAIADETGNSLKTAYSYTDGYGNVNEVQVYGVNADGITNPVLMRDTQYGYSGTGGILPTTITEVDNTSGVNLVTTQSWNLGLETLKSQTLQVAAATGGLTTSWTYDPFGRKASEVEPDQTSTNFVYTPCATDCGVGAAYELETTHYASDGVTTGATSDTKIDSFGRTLETSRYILNDQQVLQDTQYNNFGLVTHQSAPYIAGGQQYWTVSSYDDLQRVEKIKKPADQDTPGGTQTFFCYNTRSCSGSVGSTAGTAGAAAQYAVTQTVTTSVTDGNAPSFSTVKMTDSQGNVTEIDDAENTLSYGVSAFGDVISISGSGQALSMDYDSVGHKTDSTDLDMGKWFYQNDPMGEVTSQTDANGTVITQNFDMLGRMVSRTEPDSLGNPTASSWTYDISPNGPGQLAAEANAGFQKTYSYDPAGRPNGTDTTIGGVDYITAVGYDNFGHVNSQSYPGTAPLAVDAVPIANAGPNQTVIVNSPVTLDGTGSSDPDGGPQPLTYVWSQVAGPTNVGIDGARTGTVGFNADTPGAYTFQLMVGDGQTQNTANVSVTVQPAAPGAITFTPAGPSTTGTYTVNWGSSTGASSYALYESTDGVNFSTSGCTYTGTSTNPSLTGKGNVAQNMTYSYEVQGCANGVNGPFGPVGTIQVNLVPNAASATITPQDQGAGSGYTSSGDYTLSWTAPSTGNPQSYNIYQSLNGGSFTSVGTAAGSALSYPPFTGMGSTSIDNKYKYYVAACDTGGCASSNTVSITVTLETSAPGKPTFNVTGTDTTGNYTIKWTAPTTGYVTNYEVFQSTNNSTWTEIDPGNLTALQLPVTGMSNGTYYYQVAACNVNVCNRTASSSIVVLLPPGKPGSFSLSPSSITNGDSFTLTWTAASGSVSYYQVNGDSSLQYSSGTRSVSYTSVHDGTHPYYLQACNNSGCGPETATLDVTVTGTITGCPPAPQQCQWIMAKADAHSKRAIPHALAEKLAAISAEAAQLRQTMLQHPPSLIPPASQAAWRKAWKSVQPAMSSIEDSQETAGTAAPGTVEEEYEDASESAVYHLRPSDHRSLQTRLKGAPASGYQLQDAGSSTANFTVDYAYDEHEILQSVVDDQDPTVIYWQAGSMDQWGHDTTELFGNNVTSTTTYDNATGLVNSVQSGEGSAPNVQNLVYTWDGYGNLNTRSDQRANPNLLETFQYDDLNRIASSTVTGSSAGPAPLSVTYGSLGQIKNKSDVGNFITAPGHLGQISEVDLTGGGKITYGYDNNGNLKTSSDGRTVNWTAENRPSLITSSTGSSQISYDPDGDRYQEYNVTGGSGATVTEIGSVMEVVAPDSGNASYRLFIQAGGRTVAVRTVYSTGTFSIDYMHRDHLGSVDSISDLSTETTDLAVQYMSFDTYGQRRCSATWGPVACDTGLSSITDRGYTDQQELDSVGLVHMEGRVYDPMLGRFMSADPNMPDMYNSQDMNRYAYVNNNPLNHTDPTGFDDEALDDDVGGGGISDSFEFESGLSVPFSSDDQFEPIGGGDSTTIPTNETNNTDATLSSIIAGWSNDLKQDSANIEAKLESGARWALGDNLVDDFVGNNVANSTTSGNFTGMGKEFNILAAQVSNATNPFMHVTYTGTLNPDEKFGASGLDALLLGVGGVDEFGMKAAVEFGLEDAGKASILDEVKTQYPPNRGFQGWSESSTLMPGTIVDRYGPNTGRYLAPQGTPFSARSLQAMDQLNTFRVLKPFNVDSGLSAPWFNQPGGGVQYHTGTLTVQDLIREGFLEQIP